MSAGQKHRPPGSPPRSDHAQEPPAPPALGARGRGEAADPHAPPEPVLGLTNTLPPEPTSPLRLPTLPLEVRAEALGTSALAGDRDGAGNLAGIVVTTAIHLALVLAVLLVGRSEGRTAPRSAPRELVIETHILEVQAGSAEGTRESGPAYKRRESARPRPRRTARELHLGTSGRSAPRRPSSREPASEGPDDAADVPRDWGSQTGIDAPPGARPTDDRRGAGGTADQGALDPCFTQHAQVVAGYRAEVSGKIPPMPRPAFISVDVAQNLITSIRVAIDASGKIASVAVAKSSGNERFDSAASDHVRGVSAFPTPHRCVMYDKIKGVFRGTVTFTVSIRSR